MGNQHVGRHDVGCGLLGRFTDSNTNADSDSHTNAHSDTYAHTNGYSNADGNTNCNTHPNHNSNAGNADGHKTGYRGWRYNNINGQPQLERQHRYRPVCS